MGIASRLFRAMFEELLTWKIKSNTPFYSYFNTFSCLGIDVSEIPTEVVDFSSLSKVKIMNIISKKSQALKTTINLNASGNEILNEIQVNQKKLLEIISDVIPYVNLIVDFEHLNLLLEQILEYIDDEIKKYNQRNKNIDKAQKDLRKSQLTTIQESKDIDWITEIRLLIQNLFPLSSKLKVTEFTNLIIKIILSKFEKISELYSLKKSSNVDFKQDIKLIIRCIKNLIKCIEILVERKYITDENTLITISEIMIEYESQKNSFKKTYIKPKTEEKELTL